MSEFYKIGESITTPCDIKYSRQVVRSYTPSDAKIVGRDAGITQLGVHSVKDKVFAGTEGIIQNIYTDAKRTVLTVKFLGHRQHVTVVIKGEAHDHNPLVSGVPEEAQNVSSEASEELEAAAEEQNEPPSPQFRINTPEEVGVDE